MRRSAFVKHRRAPLLSKFDREIDRWAIPDPLHAPHPAALVGTLRAMNAAALAASLALCLHADSAAIAVLVWRMALPAAP